MNKEEEIRFASQALLNHGVVAFPTDTVMGLGVVFDDEIAYNKLNVIKRRPATKPYSMMLACKEDISKYAYVNNDISKAIDAFLPGPITFLLKAKPCVPGYVTHNTGIIGIRVVPIKEVCYLIELTGKPLLVPSANISGEPPALNSNEVKNIFGDSLDAVISGEVQIGQATTVADFSQEHVKILREGPISLTQIENAIKGE